MPKRVFKVRGAGGDSLVFADAKASGIRDAVPGSAVAYTEGPTGSGPSVMVGPDQVAALRDWCNALLERHATEARRFRF